MARNASHAQMAKAVASKAPAVVFHKTRMCRFHILGCCDITQCKFAHNKEQLRHRKPTENELEVRRNRKEEAGSLQSFLKAAQATSYKRDEVQRKPVVSGTPMPEQHDEDEKDELATGWDQPTWSRQTTEDLDLDTGDFSREVTEESQAWPTIAEVEAKSQIFTEDSLRTAMPTMGSCWQQYLLPEVSYEVKNTFIEVLDIEADVSHPFVMKRCASVPAVALA